jgi:hypothetical protein
VILRCRSFENVFLIPLIDFKMKTSINCPQTLRLLSVILISSVISITAKAQTYTTKANGAWNLALTWQGGVVPPSGTIPSSAIINIKHIVTYVGGNISNSGTINIDNQNGIAPRLIIPSGVNFSITSLGKLNVINAELRQYRFLGGLETGSGRSGKFTNDGGRVQILNSYVEIAEEWNNKGNGIVTFRNSSLAIGKAYNQSENSIDSLINTSVSMGMQGDGDYTADGLRTFFQSFRVQVASSGGKFKLKSGNINGSIDYITMKNHVTNIVGNDDLVAESSVVTSGIILNAYCVSSPSKYIPNGKFTGSRTPDCSSVYFPAGIIATQAPSALNLSINPVLISGVDKQVGAIYKYEGVAPGMDAIVRIDSIVGGATIVVLDDNAPGSGFTEGFQPQIKSGSGKGKFYAVFTFTYNISGTNTPANMSKFSITALDIDGSNTVKEFVEIGMGTGATAAYVAGSPGIAMTQTAPGTFRGINTDGNSVSGVDTSAKQYMFTVNNTNVSSYTLNMGMETTTGSSSTRLYSVYMKDFSYADAIPLPVKLGSFTATLNTAKVNLNWKTVEELNSSHFDVERSVDGKNYKSIGIVFSNENSNTFNYYLFPDNISALTDGMIYYRLKCVDIDGKFTYSDVRVIRKSSQAKVDASIVAFPNPVVNELRVTVPENWQGKEVYFNVYNMNGSILHSVRNMNVGQTETISTANLGKGVYILQVSMGAESARQKIVKN